VGDLATLITGAGGVGAFVAVIVYLLASNRADRKEYQDAVDRAEARADAAEARTRAAEQRADALQQAVDEARAARRTAEDRLYAAERELGREAGP
jgi:multidrug resistance efflux pump